MSGPGPDRADTPAALKPVTPPRPTGRPRTTMTPEVEAGILTGIRLGLTPTAASQAHGICHQTYSSHRSRNPEFAAAVEAAVAVGERNALASIVRKMQTDWRAAAWFLERRFPQRWAQLRDDLIGQEDAAQAAVGDAPRDGPQPPRDPQLFLEQLKRTASITIEVTEATQQHEGAPDTGGA